METAAPNEPPKKTEQPAASPGNGADGVYVVVDGTDGMDKPLKTETGKITRDGKYIPDNPQKKVA